MNDIAGEVTAQIAVILREDPQHIVPIEYVELAVAMRQRLQEERNGAGAGTPRYMRADE
ncbi:MAG TPA: hypothetical protein VJT80_10750 [Steroidobacteraceae bacterium]|nr:hypothetical protein [Steroidobacteraceae bacterium]